MEAELNQRFIGNAAFEEGYRQGYLRGQERAQKMKYAARLKQQGKLTEIEIADILELSLEEAQVLQ